jgi:5-methylcytosine-specific restriction endonuclease McrA
MDEEPEYELVNATAWAIELRLNGLSYAEIGKEMGCSRQYAQQLTRPPKEVYDFVKNRAKGKCENCREKIASGHVHHRSNRTGTVENYNDIENLEYLCRSCHRTKHAGDPQRLKRLQT